MGSRHLQIDPSNQMAGEGLLRDPELARPYGLVAVEEDAQDTADCQTSFHKGPPGPTGLRLVR